MFPIRRAQGGRAVPPGRLGFDLTADRYLLHTIQDEVVLEALRSDGEWIPDPAKGDRDFADAYEWLYDQMLKRIDADRRGAVWFWAKTTRAALVDQCRTAARSGRASVLLTCRIDPARLLLSHFGDWHCVLNRTLNVLPLPGETDAAWEDRWGLMFDAFHDGFEVAGVAKRSLSWREWPDDLRRQAEESWDTIFDAERFVSNGGRRQRWPGAWQATASHLLATDVVEAVVIEPSGRQ